LLLKLASMKDFYSITCRIYESHHGWAVSCIRKRPVTAPKCALEIAFEEKLLARMIKGVLLFHHLFTRILNDIVLFMISGRPTKISDIK
jgi:hypothetical protein